MAISSQLTWDYADCKPWTQSLSPTLVSLLQCDPNLTVSRVKQTSDEWTCLVPHAAEYLFHCVNEPDHFLIHRRDYIPDGPDM